MLPDNEIAEPQAFTVCKQGVAQKQQCCSHILDARFRLVVNNGQKNKRKARCNKTKRNQGTSVNAQFRRGTHDEHEISG